MPLRDDPGRNVPRARRYVFGGGPTLTVGGYDKVALGPSPPRDSFSTLFSRFEKVFVAFVPENVLGSAPCGSP